MTLLNSLYSSASGSSSGGMMTSGQNGDIPTTKNSTSTTYTSNLPAELIAAMNEFHELRNDFYVIQKYNGENFTSYVLAEP